MNRLLSCALLLAALVAPLGCSICHNGNDCAYPYYGGRWQRSDMCCGRVGSVFEPAGGPADGGHVIAHGAALPADGEIIYEDGAPAYSESLPDYGEPVPAQME